MSNIAGNLVARWQRETMTRREPTPMQRRRSGRVLAVCGWISALGLLALAAALPAFADFPPTSTRYEYWREIVSQTLAFSTVGAVIVWHRPSQRIGRLLLCAGICPALGLLAGQYALLSVPPPQGTIWVLHAADVVSNVNIACWSLLLLCFPDGSLPTRRWRPVVWILVAGLITNLLFLVTTPGPLHGAPSVRNPLGGLGGDLVRSYLQNSSGWLMTGAAACAIASPIVRFRRSHGRERQEVKVLVYAVAWAVLLLIIQAFIPWSFPYALAYIFWLFGPAGIAWAIGTAVLRHQLYGIDRVISRTVSYALLTGMLGILYVLGTLLVGTVLQPAVGESPVAVAGVTLALAAVFVSARRGVQDLVDRRFNRARYDAAVIVEHFNARLRDQLDLKEVGDRLLDAVHVTVHPTEASLWLTDLSTRAGDAEGGRQQARAVEPRATV